MLALRSGLSTIIGLYTSRVVLSVLGIDDYGLYAVAGSVVGLLGFLTGSLSGATSRFITFEMGRGNFEGLRRMFASTLSVHLALALVVVLFGETIGLWILENKLNLDPERMTAARWVYHLSVATAALSITQTPYSAIIMAYERMGVYARFEILTSLLRLLNVYLLMVAGTDKLITYAVLGFCVSVLMLAVNRIYCIRNFKECRSMPEWDFSVLRRIFAYAGLSIISVFCVNMCFQGTTFLFNIFFGVAANAAVSVAATVHGITMQFGANMQNAFRPQVTKQYAAGNHDNSSSLTAMSAKFTILIMASMVVPCIIEAPLILHVWLGEVPPMSVEFLRCMLAVGWIGCLSNMLDTVVHSTGSIGRLTFNKSLLFLLNLGAIYLLFCAGAPAWSAYASNGVMYMCLVISTLFVIRRLVPRFRVRDFTRAAGRGFAAAGLAACPLLLITATMDSSLLRVALLIAVYLPALAATSWTLVLTKDEKINVRALAAERLAQLRNMFSAQASV